MARNEGIIKERFNVLIVKNGATMQTNAGIRIKNQNKKITKMTQIGMAKGRGRVLSPPPLHPTSEEKKKASQDFPKMKLVLKSLTSKNRTFLTNIKTIEVQCILGTIIKHKD